MKLGTSTGEKRTMKRPAETTAGVAGALAALLGPRLGIDAPGEVAALAVVLGAIPAGITFIVSRTRP